MTERVRINYTIPMEELPQEIGRLLVQTSANIQQLDTEGFLSCPVLSVTTLKEVSALRASLYDIDCQLRDVEMLIGSYIQHLTRPPEADNSQAQALSDAEGALKNIQSMIRPLASAEDSSDEEPS